MAMQALNGSWLAGLVASARGTPQPQPHDACIYEFCRAGGAAGRVASHRVCMCVHV